MGWTAAFSLTQWVPLMGEKIKITITLSQMIKLKSLMEESANKKVKT